MLDDSHCPVGSGQRLGINIIRCTLQVFDALFVKQGILLGIENTEVEGVGTENPIALAVENLDGKQSLAVTIQRGVIAPEEFLPDYFFYFADDLVEP